MIPGSLTDFMYELILHKMLTWQRVELFFLAWYTILANRHKTCSRTTECPIRKKTARGLATYINWLKYSVRSGCSKAGISWKSMFMTGLHVKGGDSGVNCVYVCFYICNFPWDAWLTRFTDRNRGSIGSCSLLPHEISQDVHNNDQWLKKYLILISTFRCIHHRPANYIN